MLQAVPDALFSEVFISDELMARPAQQADFRREKMAIQDLAIRMLENPDDVLPRFVELAMEMTGGCSAGLSLYEQDPHPGIFRWSHLCGSLAAFEGATTPRHYSPCGITLDRAAPVLTRHAERAYSWISDADIIVPEVLLVPLYIGSREPLGTLWIVSNVEGHFTSEHARVATELATFAGIALHVRRGQARLQQSLEEQETLTREMSHRVKNLFALTDAMIRQSLKGSATKEEMAQALSGRLGALASAHSLVLRDPTIAHEEIDLGELVKAVAKPYDNPEPGYTARVSISGVTLTCDERTASGLALVINELATNAVKYGSLGCSTGTVSISWTASADGEILLTWTETGGPAVTAPNRAGFGSKLVEMTVVRQFGGSLNYQWHPEGLLATLSLPASSFLKDDPRTMRNRSIS